MLDFVLPENTKLRSFTDETEISLATVSSSIYCSYTYNDYLLKSCLFRLFLIAGKYKRKTFEYDSAECDSACFEHGRTNWSRSCHAEFDISSEFVLQLAKHQLVPDGIVADHAALQLLQFRLIRRVEEELSNRSGLGQSLVDFIVETIQQSRHRRKHRWLQNLENFSLR